MTEEYLDLVDENDHVIGRKSRKEIYALGIFNFRVINAFLKNSQGQLWIPRRSPHKALFPGCLDMSVGGHVESGESYEQAFKRELAEELNLNADDVSWRSLGHLTQADGVSVFMEVFEISTDVNPNYNPDEFTEYAWMTPQELIKKIEGGECVKSDLPLLIHKYYL